MAEEQGLPVLKKKPDGGYEATYSNGSDLPVLKKKEPTTTDSSQPVKPSTQSGKPDYAAIAVSAAEMNAQRAKSEPKKEVYEPLELQKIDITQRASSTATAPKSIERTTVNVKDIYRGKSSDQFDLKAIEQKKRQSDGVDRINALSEENAFYNAVENDYLEYLQNEDENKYSDTKSKLDELRQQQKTGDLSLGQEKWLKDFRSQAVNLKNEALADRVKFMTDSPQFKSYERKSAILDQIGADEKQYAQAASESGIVPEMIAGIKDAERNFINSRFASEKAEQDFPNAAQAEKENLIKEIDRTAKAQTGNTEFFNQFSGTVGRGALSVLQTPKVLSDMFGDTDYTLVDELYDKMEGMKFSREGNFGALREKDLPAMYQLSEIAGQAAGSMAMFASGGIGATSKVQQISRTASTAFLTSQPEYYAEAIAMGKSPKEAATDANVLALVTSMAEGVVPDISLLEGQAFKRSVSAAYKSGKTVKEAIKLAVNEMPAAFKERALDIGTGMLKEGGEEVFQTGTGDVTKEALNLRSNVDYETFDADNYKKALLGGFVAGGGVRVIASAMPKSKEMKSVIRDVVENKDEILSDMESVGADSKEAKTVLDEASDNLNALKSHSNWDNLSKEKQDDAFALTQQAKAIEEEQAKLSAVRAVDLKKDLELKAIEDELNATLNKPQESNTAAVLEEIKAGEDGVVEIDRDQILPELQRQRAELGVEFDPMDDLPDTVVSTFDRVESGLPTDPVQVSEASDWLYSKYKALSAMKADPNRMLTIEQIEAIQEQLGKDIETLENYTNENQISAEETQLEGQIVSSTIAEEEKSAIREEIKTNTINIPLPSLTTNEGGGVNTGLSVNSKGTTIDQRRVPSYKKLGYTDEDIDGFNENEAVQIYEKQIEKPIVESTVKVETPIGESEQVVEAVVEPIDKSPVNLEKNWTSEGVGVGGDVEEKVSGLQHTKSQLEEIAKEEGIDNAIVSFKKDLDVKENRLAELTKYEKGKLPSQKTKSKEIQSLEKRIEEVRKDVENLEKIKVEQSLKEAPQAGSVVGGEVEITAKTITEKLSKQQDNLIQSVYDKYEGEEASKKIKELFASKEYKDIEEQINQLNPGGADLSGFEKTLSERDAEDYSKYREIGYRLVAADKKNGYKPFKVTESEKKQYAELRKRFDSMFADYSKNVDAENAKTKSKAVEQSLKETPQPVQQDNVGKEGEIKFTSEKKVPVRYKLIEADELQPSHLSSGERNPMHQIASAQPKERNDAGSKMAQDKIANNPNLDEVGESPNAYFGAPIVNSRGEVIQGNNRSIGLKKHYKGNGTKYKSDLEANAEKFGLTKEQVAGMKNPILVREVDVNDQEAIELGQYDVKDLETGGKQRIDPIATSRKMSPSDKAKVASLVSSGEFKTVKDAIRANAKKIADVFKGYINPAQGKNTFNPDGSFTSQGMDDVSAVISNFLFDGGKAVLPEVFDKLAYNIKEGIQKALPYILSVSDGKSLKSHVQNAMLAIYQFNSSGQTNFDAWTNELDLFTGGSPKDAFLPVELAIAKKLIDAKTQNEVKDIFQKYESITSDKPADMFNEAQEGLSKQDAIKEQFNVPYNENEQVTDAKPQSKPSGEGTTNAEKPETKREQVKPETITSLKELDVALELKGKEATEARNKLKEKYGKKTYENMLKVTRNFEKIINDLESQGKITKRC